MKNFKNIEKIKKSEDFTNQELKILRKTMMLFYSFCGLYYKITQPQDESKIIRTVKQLGDNKGQYGYYINTYITEIISFIKIYKIESFLDLGCGNGLLLSVINNICNIKTKGYEIEDKLIKESLGIANVEKKDILKLNSTDINNYKCLYFWEPLCDQKLAEQFVNNLIPIMPKNQVILYRRSGYIGEFLMENVKKKHLKRLNNFGLLEVYYKL